MILCGGLAVIATGATLSSRTEVNGLHRNAVAALVASYRQTRNRSEPVLAQTELGNPGDLRSLKGMVEGYNVIVVTLESTGSRFLKPYGGMIDPMPNLTRLAKESL